MASIYSPEENKNQTNCVINAFNKFHYQSMMSVSKAFETARICFAGAHCT